MAGRSGRLCSPGLCSEMSLLAFWIDYSTKCSCGVNKEVFLRGLRRFIVSSMGPNLY